MINSAPNRNKLITILAISLFSILHADTSIAPAFRLGYFGTNSSTTYGSILQKESNVSYNTNGIEIEAGIIHKWVSLNGYFSCSQRNSFPQRGIDGREQIVPGKPSIYGGGISAYLERLKIPFQNDKMFIRFSPGILIGYWVDNKSKWNDVKSEYQEIIDKRHFAGVLRVDGGYGIISGYWKIGLFETSNVLLGAGITIIPRRKK